MEKIISEHTGKRAEIIYHKDHCRIGRKGIIKELVYIGDKIGIMFEYDDPIIEFNGMEITGCIIPYMSHLKLL